MRRALRFAVALGVWAAVRGDGLSAQVVRGFVADVATRRAVPYARVDLVDAEGAVMRTTVADSSGLFEFTAAGEGVAYIHAEANGYLSTLEGPVTLRRNYPIVLDLLLQVAPLELPGLDISVGRRQARLAASGFYERLRLGQGHFIDRSMIEERAPRTVSDLLRAVPGVSVDNTGVVTLRGISSLKGCNLKVYLDGALTLADPDWANQLINPHWVDGIEIYRRPSEVPPQYGGADAACGVVLIWSRR